MKKNMFHSENLLGDSKIISDYKTVKTSAKSKATQPPWLIQGLKSLNKLKNLKDNWNGYGSEAPKAVALNNAHDVLNALNNEDFSIAPTNVMPSADNGVAISFRNGEYYAIIECYNSGDIRAAVSTGIGNVVSWACGVDPSELKKTVKRVYNHINVEELKKVNPVVEQSKEKEIPMSSDIKCPNTIVDLYIIDINDDLFRIRNILKGSPAKENEINDCLKNIVESFNKMSDVVNDHSQQIPVNKEVIEEEREDEIFEKIY